MNSDISPGSNLGGFNPEALYQEEVMIDNQEEREQPHYS
jgi:hypothetical protein